MVNGYCVARIFPGWGNIAEPNMDFLEMWQGSGIGYPREKLFFGYVSDKYWSLREVFKTREEAEDAMLHAQFYQPGCRPANSTCEDNSVQYLIIPITGN